MILSNLLNLTNQLELNREEERLSKIRAKELFELNLMDSFDVGTFHGLSQVHGSLFQDVYPFAGQVSDVNISKGDVRFAPVMYLQPALENIDKMPMTTFDDIVKKYVEMNIAHPFREGNGRSMRIWLDAILKSQLKQVVDWNLIDKEDYLMAMERSSIKDIEIKYLLEKALTDKINDREVYMKGIDISYYYEGYTEFLVDELKIENDEKSKK